MKKQGIRFAAVIAAMVVAGCTHVNHLRNAQDDFNRAAEAENRLRFDSAESYSQTTLTAWNTAHSGYRSALAGLEELNGKEIAKLKNDGLWGTALTLKAMSQWRLGQFDAALKTAGEAEQSAANQLYPRDSALLAALPGLIKTDQGFSKLENNSGTFADVKELLVGSKGAVADIEKARKKVGKIHPVQGYLIQAQLAAYRNYTVAVYRLTESKIVPPDDPAKAAAQKQIQQLHDLYKDLRMQSDETNALVSYWVKVCALTLPQI